MRTSIASRWLFAITKECRNHLRPSAFDPERKSDNLSLDLPRVIIVKFQRYFVTVLFLALLAIARSAAAQSTDQSLPTPVLSSEINGRIAALDLGDPRLTRHFYAFEGVPGDLLVTLSSRNLNGDIDIFTAITFRPIMKITMYAGGSSLSPEVTKGFYLRARQVLILRVEARTPNDDAGTYQIHFGGAYEPFSGGIPVAEESTEQSTEVARTSGGNKTRLSSVGARIEEPPSDTTAKPAEKSAEETASSSTSSAKVTKPKSPKNSAGKNCTWSPSTDDAIQTREHGNRKRRQSPRRRKRLRLRLLKRRKNPHRWKQSRPLLPKRSLRRPTNPPRRKQFLSQARV